MIPVVVAETVADGAPVAFVNDWIVARERVNIAPDDLGVDLEDQRQFLLAK